jgi:hypothetical protein
MRGRLHMTTTTTFISYLAPLNLLTLDHHLVSLLDVRMTAVLVVRFVGLVAQ